MRSALLVIIMTSAIAVFSGCSPSGFSSASVGKSSNQNPGPNSSVIPLTASHWNVPYDGYGYVNFSADGSSIEFAPQVVTDPNDTSAVLVLTNKFETNPTANFRATLVVKTVSQTRTPTPNTWETFWFFFNYKLDSNDKKMTNYFTLKPNGYELGTAWNELDQAYLATGTTPALTLGLNNTMVLEMLNEVLTVTIDGIQIFSYDNNASTDKMYVHPGNFGLYCEDAEVLVSSVKIEVL